MMHVLVRGMALHAGPLKALKKMPAMALLRRLKKYKDSYKTFPHMTSPYVYPSLGMGSELPQAVAEVVQEHGGRTFLGRPIDRLLFDESGAVCGIVSEGIEVHAIGWRTARAAGERRRVCLLYTSPSPRDGLLSRMPSSA